MLNTQQRTDLAKLNAEAFAITNKRKQTPQDEMRFGLIQSEIASVKSGATLTELRQERVNEVAARSGLPTTYFGDMTAEQRAVALEFAKFGRRERRDVENVPLTGGIGTYSSLGYFVPTGWASKISSALKAYDAIFDDDAVTVLRTANGIPIPLPTMDDTTINAAISTEGGSQTVTNIANIANEKIAAWSYNSKRWDCSIEFLQDGVGAFSALEIFKNVAGGRLARQIGHDLMVGSGSSQPLGLVTALLAAGVTPVTATGSANNTGINTQTAVNSVGTADFANMLAQLDPAYLADPKVAFFMNWSTYTFLLALADKMGKSIVNFQNGAPTIFGIRVRICPSMDSIGAAKNPVILGAGSYWLTRLVENDSAEGYGIMRYTNAPGLAENGMVGFSTNYRADGALLWNSPNTASCPFVVLQNHS